MKFRGMRHIALRVSDLDRSVDFYQQAFGMRAFGPRKHGSTVVPLVSPNFRDQITLNSAPESGETGRDLGKPGEMGGIDHFGFIVSPSTNLDKIRDHLCSCGATFLKQQDIAANAPSLFFSDPDGYLFQVTRFPRFTRAYIAALPWINRHQK